MELRFPRLPGGPPARTCIVGAGAIGGIVAGRLARAGVRATVVDGDDAHVARLRDPGLVIQGDGDDLPIPLDSYTPDEAPHGQHGPYDLVVLAVRSGDTQRALAPLRDHLGGDVVSLQNGLNEDRIAELVGPERTIGAVVGFGALRAAPGRIELTSSGGLVIGRLDGREDDRLHRACAILERAVPCEVTDQIQAALWHKMVVNNMTVLGALGGVATGEVLRQGPRRRLVEAVVAETTRVALATGTPLTEVLGVKAQPIAAREAGWQDELGAVLDVIAEHFAEVRSTVLQDFQRQRPAEIDAIVGEVVRRGEALGVPVPVSARVAGLLREIDQGRLTPDPAHLDALAASLDAS